MGATLPSHHLLLPAKPRPTPPRRDIRAFRRGGDFGSFVRRVTSGEVLRDAWRGANQGFETLIFEVRRTALHLDRRFSISRNFDSAARSATARARELDQELGIGRRWHAFSVDFYRNWPRYRRELNGYVETPLGRAFVTIFFLWFALSGWLFRFFILATWVLPFAAPLLIGTFSKNFIIEGACPACRTRFVGYRNQTIRCSSCRNVVWQPGGGSGGGGGVSGRGTGGGGNPFGKSPPEPDIIDIEIEEK